MNADLLNLGIRHLRKRADYGELTAQAVLDELLRLYRVAAEPPHEALTDPGQPALSAYATRYLYETIHDGKEADDG